MDLWIQLIIGIVPAIGAFLGAVAQNKSDIKKLQKQHELDLHSLREKHVLDMKALENQQQHELNRITTEFEGQTKLYEQNKQADMIASFMSNPAMSKFVQQMLVDELAAKKKR